MKRRASSKRAGQFCPRYRQRLQGKKPPPALHIPALPAESFRAYFQKTQALSERVGGRSKDYNRGWCAGYAAGSVVAAIATSVVSHLLCL